MFLFQFSISQWLCFGFLFCDVVISVFCFPLVFPFISGAVISFAGFSVVVFQIPVLCWCYFPFSSGCVSHSCFVVVMWCHFPFFLWLCFRFLFRGGVVVSFPIFFSGCVSTSFFVVVLCCHFPFFPVVVFQHPVLWWCCVVIFNFFLWLYFSFMFCGGIGIGVLSFSGFQVVVFSFLFCGVIFHFFSGCVSASCFVVSFSIFSSGCVSASCFVVVWCHFPFFSVVVFQLPVLWCCCGVIFHFFSGCVSASCFVVLLWCQFPIYTCFQVAAQFSSKYVTIFTIFS